MGEQDGQLWTCRKCQQVLGVVRNGALHLSLLASVETQVRVRCERCRAHQTWYPPPMQSRIGEVKTVGGA